MAHPDINSKATEPGGTGYVRSCLHVREQGAHPVAKWNTDRGEVVLCRICDGKVREGNRTPLVFADYR